uniref:Uncharacterized protein n=1 Tax=Ditylenchus dipsaci TaxID=166011 RepID=A0A915D7W5_9BILA
MLAPALLLLRQKASEFLFYQNAVRISPVRTRKSVHSSVGKRHTSDHSISTSSKPSSTNTISSSDRLFTPVLLPVLRLGLLDLNLKILGLRLILPLLPALPPVLLELILRQLHSRDKSQQRSLFECGFQIKRESTLLDYGFQRKRPIASQS